MSEERMGTSSSHDGHKDISNTDRVSLISAAVNSALSKQRQLFIGELDSKLGQPTRTAIKTVDDFVFQKEGNKIQHKFNTDRAIRLSDILTLVQSNRCEYAEVAIRSELEEIQQRNKLIKIADDMAGTLFVNILFILLLITTRTLQRFVPLLQEFQGKDGVLSPMKGDLHLFCQTLSVRKSRSTTRTTPSATESRQVEYTQSSKQ